MKNIKSFEAFDTELDNRKLYLTKDRKFGTKSDSLPKQKVVDKIKDIFYNVAKAKEIISNVKWEDLTVKSISDKFYRIYLPDFVYTQLRKSNIYFDYVEFKVEDVDLYNRVHTTGIPDKLKGIGLGYKCYKALTKYLGWISSQADASVDAVNVWKKLIRDNDFYSAVSNNSVVIIDKDINKEKIKDILLKFLEFNEINVDGSDDTLIKKLADRKYAIKLDNSLKNLFRDDQLIRRLDIDYLDRVNKFKK